jgi:hypothetical protein
MAVAPGSHTILKIVSKGHSEVGTAEPAKKKIYNVWMFQRTSSTGSPSKSDALTAFQSTIFTPLMNCLSINYILDSFDVHWLDDWEDRTTNVVPGSAVGGAVTGDSLPSLNCVSVVLRATKAGRQGCTGAKRFALIPESGTLFDAVSAAGVTVWSTFCTAYQGGFTAGGFTYLPFIVSSQLTMKDGVRKGGYSQLHIPTDPALVPQPSVVYGPINIVGNVATSVKYNPILGQMHKRKQPYS